jgi:hypothetical protein
MVGMLAPVLSWKCVGRLILDGLRRDFLSSLSSIGTLTIPFNYNSITLFNTFLTVVIIKGYIEKILRINYVHY